MVEIPNQSQQNVVADLMSHHVHLFVTSDLNCAEEGDVTLPQLEGGSGPDVPVQRPL